MFFPFIGDPLIALNTIVTGQTGDGRKAKFGDYYEAGVTVLTAGGMETKEESPVVGRRGAFREAKADAKIPRGQDPDKIPENNNKQYRKVPLTDRNGKAIMKDGKPVTTREYTYTLPDGKKIIIQDHSAGHQFGEGGVGDQGPHFNVRPSDNTRTGKVPGTQPHYNFLEPFGPQASK